MSAVPQETKVTTMAELRRPGAPEASLPAVRMGFADLQGFELMQRAAKAMAASTLVPTQFQGNLPNCIIALEMANRIGASPLMVCQNLYVVHGRPAWSAKFLIASFNQCGRFSAIRYDWVGERGKEGWGCRAWAIERETQRRIEGPTITLALAREEGWYDRSGSKWKTIPELMLMYRAAAWLVNTHAPEISMGLNTAEEVGDVYDATPGPQGYTVSTEDLRETHAGAASPQPSDNQPGTPSASTFENAGNASKMEALKKKLRERRSVGAPERTSAGKNAAAPPSESAKESIPALTYAQVMDRINRAHDVEMLDAESLWISQVRDEGHQYELQELYQQRRAELGVK